MKIVAAKRIQTVGVAVELPPQRMCIEIED